MLVSRTRAAGPLLPIQRAELLEEMHTVRDAASVRGLDERERGHIAEP